MPDKNDGLVLPQGGTPETNSQGCVTFDKCSYAAFE
jgi:hypothetical protein